MRIRRIFQFLTWAGVLLVFTPFSCAAQKPNSTRDTNSSRTPMLVTIVVRDTAGASTGLTPTVQLTGEAQDGTVYTGNPTNKGDQWTFVVPGPGIYTAQVSAP